MCMAVKKSVLWGAALVLLAAGLAVVVGSGGSEASEGTTPGAGGSSRQGARDPLRPGGGPSGGTAALAPALKPLREDPEIQKLADYLRTRYGGEKLKNAYVQVKLIEDLMRFFQKNYPDRWEEALREFLRETYPERYEELAAKLRARLDYERWMKEHEADLQRLGDEERRKNVWEQREKLFGKEAAEQIWASELKNQAVQSSLSALDARTDVKVAQKVKLYRESLQEVYGEQTEAYLERHRQEAMNRFLDLSSVQKELSELKPEERSRGLREIRTGMGLDAEALQRWDSLDTERDARWDVGLKYMREREALATQYTGAALEERLRPLRERYFAAEAETIAQEEESGFLRFTRPRVWGRN
jgi:hypothetical protein